MRLGILLSSLLVSILAIPEPVVLDLVNNPPKQGETVTRLIKVDYTFETESLVYDDIENKVTTPSILFAGNFSFDTLHYDSHGNILARFKITACRSGPCDMATPPVFVHFVQGGNNIENVYIDTEGGTITPSWNYLFGIINTIYTPALNGEGDDQTVDTVYGRCRVQFGRPENKKFRRIIDGCEIGNKEDNYTRIEYQDYFHYNQDVLYTQNTKVDADIIIIDAIELLSVRTPFEERWGFQLESRTHVEITNRSQYYVDRLCDAELADECATKVLGLTRVGDKLYEGVQKGLQRSPQLISLLNKYREHLFDMGDSHTCTQHSSLYAEIFEAARKSTPGDWGRAIQAPENEPLLPTIGNILGALGTPDSLLVAREVLISQGAEFLDDYLFGAAHAVTNDEKWHKQLIASSLKNEKKRFQYWLAETPKTSEDHWKIANTMATIARRRCEKTPSSLNSCQKGKDRLVEKFIEDLTKCNCSICITKSLEVLENLPLPQTYEYAKSFLCSASHPESVQSAALRLIAVIPSQYYESKLVHLLVKLFRDTCPKQTKILDAHLAVNILANCVPDLQNSATLILRSEVNSPADHERWQYFYSKVKASGERDELKEEFWKRMRAFKIFRPNYVQRSLLADSFSHYQSLDEVGEFHLQQEFDSHFESGNFRGSDLRLFAKRGKKTHDLFQSDFFSPAGIPGLSSSSDHSAGSRVSLLGHSLPVHHLFSNKGGMLDKLYEADGQTMKAFHGNVVLRLADVTFPLISGASVDFYSRGAATISLLPSVGVNLQFKEVSADVSVNVSVALSTQANLVFAGKSERIVGSELSAVTSFGVVGEALAEEENEHVCQSAQRKDIILNLEMYETGKPKRIKRKTLPGKTFYSHSKAISQCNEHLSSLTAAQLRVPVDQL